MFAIMLLFSTALMAQTDDDDMSMNDNNNNSDVAQTADKQQLMSDAQKAKAAFVANDSKLSQLFDGAKGYVIFPNVGKGAYILGGAAGNGVVYQNGSAVGYSELRQIDIGLQIGGQAFREAIIFNTQAALDDFKKGNYRLTGDATAVIVEQGKSKAVDFTDGRAVLVMPKAGAMVGISVGGQKFEYRDIQ
ncbi:MAG: lipid-binding SYLF domain-containing protein [Gillisia sp.]